MNARLVLIPLSLALLVSPSASAQSRVTDILLEQARVAARAAQVRADIWRPLILDLADLPVAILERRPVTVHPVVVAAPEPLSPVWDAQQRYLEEALAYEKARDLAARAAHDVQLRSFRDALASEHVQHAAVRAPAAPNMSLTVAPLPTAEAGGCGITPIKPIPPIGCRDLVAQCVQGANGSSYWQWVCVK